MMMMIKGAPAGRTTSGQEDCLGRGVRGKMMMMMRMRMMRLMRNEEDKENRHDDDDDQRPHD